MQLFLCTEMFMALEVSKIQTSHLLKTCKSVAPPPSPPPPPAPIHPQMLPCFFNLCDTLSSNETTAYQVWQPKVCWCIKWRTEGFSSCLKSAIQTSVQACLMTMNCYKPSLDRYHYQANRLMMTDCYKPSLDRYQVNRLMMTDCYKPSPDRYHYQANCLMMMDCYKPSLDRYQANSLMATFCHKPSLDRYQANSLMATFCHKLSLDRYHANSFLLLQDLKNSM